MKKKLFIVFAFAIMFVMMFTVVSFADSVHNENTVNYTQTVTLDDGTVLPLYDEDKDALIWYISATGQDGKNIYTSIKSQDSQVKWWTKSWGEVTALSIVLDDGTKYDGSKFAVVNMMDDDVISNAADGDHTNLGKPITGFKWIFNGWKNLEYVFLRLDTTGIYATSFQNCSKLKYINLEDLTKLTRIGDSNNFAGCTSLFEGQVLDLRNTSLTQIDWGGSFSKVPFVEIKLPSTISRFSGSFEGSGLVKMSFPLNMGTVEANMFKNCLSLKSVCVNNKTTKIGENVFLGCTAFETFCFVGSKSELEALIANTSTTGNEPFFAVVGENNANLISYADYQKLDDKSGKYAIYDYSYCEAYIDGVHTDPDVINDCTGYTCDYERCSHWIKTRDAHNLLETMEYANGFAQVGVEKITCTNWDKCTVKNESWEIEPIFTAKGYSTNSEKNAINGGYTIKSELLARYETVMNEKITYGVVIANANSFGYKTFFDEENRVNSKKALQVEIDSQYSMFDCEINFGSNTAVELDLIICAYVINADGEASFIQKDSGKDITIGGAPFKSITLNSVIALVPTALKED